MIPFEKHITEDEIMKESDWRKGKVHDRDNVMRSCAPSPDYDPLDHHGNVEPVGCGHPPIEPTLHEAIVSVQAGIDRLLEYDISEPLRQRLLVANVALEEEAAG